jgi:arsenate reductase
MLPATIRGDVQGTPQNTRDHTTHATSPSVLFLCTGNSCRSQMAEGWARHLRADTIQAHSAGTNPHGLNPMAVRAMAEVGVDISKHTSKRPEEIGVDFDYVVTVCDSANESCPVFAAKTRVVHVGFDDPPRLAKEAKSDEEAMAHYRRVRDEIKAYIMTLPGSLTGSPTALGDQPTKAVSTPTIKVFDPPMCCSSGVCGPDPDVALARFAADLRWLQGQGVAVHRFALTQQPEQFAAEPIVLQAMKARGSETLPIVMVNGAIISEREYPSREQLAAKLGLSTMPVALSAKSGGCGWQPGKCC